MKILNKLAQIKQWIIRIVSSSCFFKHNWTEWVKLELQYEDDVQNNMEAHGRYCKNCLKVETKLYNYC